MSLDYNKKNVVLAKIYEKMRHCRKITFGMIFYRNMR